MLPRKYGIMPVMLDIAFDKLLTPTASPRASSEVTLKSVRKSNRRKISGYALKLGEAGRLKDLPDKVDEDFLAQYQDGLDAYLHAYVASHALTLSEAARYKEYIFDTVFGNNRHLGIFQFLRAKASNMYETDKDMVVSAENFLMRGWHIQLDEEGRYWLADDTFTRLLEVTGSSDLSQEAASTVFTPDSAHLFLSDEVASRVYALAKKSGFDADTLASMGQLDMLLMETDNRELAGYLINYNAMRFLLKKSGKYRVLKTPYTLETLYEEGYRLGSQIFYPTLSRVILENKGDAVLLTPVSSELHPEHVVNKSLLATVAGNVRTTLYSTSKHITPQFLAEIGELGYTIALRTEFWGSGVVRYSASDIRSMLLRIDQGLRAGSISPAYYRNLRTAFSEILLTEVMLLGNSKFSLSSFTLDSVGGKFFVYAGDNVFMSGHGEGRAVTITEDSSEFFSQFLTADNPYRFAEENLGVLATQVSDKYVAALRSVDLDVGNYHLDMPSVREFFGAAKERVLSAVR